MMSIGTEPNDRLWQELLNLLPQAEKIARGARSDLTGMIRRHLLQEQEEEFATQAIFRQDDIAGLRALIASVPTYSPAERESLLAELTLTSEEMELEKANWNYRHQMSSGDLLIGVQLGSFRLVRLNVYDYILLYPQAFAQVKAQFVRAFDREPQVSSAKPWTAGEETWLACAWFLDPDPAQAEIAADEIRRLWEA